MTYHSSPDVKKLDNRPLPLLSDFCPFCFSKDFVKRGVRQRKHSVAQLYICKNPNCGKTFTAEAVKGKRFPLEAVIEGMSYYNLGFTFEESSKILRQKYGIEPAPETISEWVEEYKPLCRFERLRPYATKLYKPKEMVEVVTMAHRQLYRFRYHRAKIRLMLEEFKNRDLYPLKEYLDSISTETPHQFFSEGERMSDIRSKFNTAEMIVKSKANFANRLASFVLGAVRDNKRRHEELQRFFLANDSVTVATEVPVYIRKEDVTHFENVLKFKVLDETGNLKIKGKKMPETMPRLLTGHIDILQIRNGQAHILDYKPRASKEKPIEQLTWYALALSRLTGLRLFNFTCAWFDEKDFYQFYPLHVVRKLERQNIKKVKFKDGTIGKIDNENILKII